MRGFRTKLLAGSLLCLPAALLAQVESPAPVSNSMPTNNFGFNLPSHLGTLSYSASASEMLETGYGSVDANTSVSGNLAFLSKSENDPTSLVYSGGLLFTTVPGYSSTETFQNIAASQVFRTKSWVFVASDAFGYMPDSPTTGLSGIAGVGDVGIFPPQTGIGPTQDILTNYATRISNGLQGSATWQTTASLEFGGTGSWQILHFLGGQPGLNTDDVSGSVGPNYRIDARNSVGANATYSELTYPGYANYKIQTVGANIDYTRAWSRRLSTTFSFGPAKTTGATLATIPAQWNLQGSAQMSYATRTTGFSASYMRAVSGGSGILFGALTDTVTAGMSRPLNRDWILGLNLGYSHSSSLVPYSGLIPVYDSTYGGAQISRRLTESLSIYGSYTGISQSAKNQPAYLSTAFNGLNNIVSVGITFAPAPLMSGK